MIEDINKYQLSTFITYHGSTPPTPPDTQKELV